MLLSLVVVDRVLLLGDNTIVRPFIRLEFSSIPGSHPMLEPLYVLGFESRLGDVI